jgi:hypothetical protein
LAAAPPFPMATVQEIKRIRGVMVETLRT